VPVSEELWPGELRTLLTKRGPENMNLPNARGKYFDMAFFSLKEDEHDEDGLISGAHEARNRNEDWLGYYHVDTIDPDLRF
jgi:hypothetical protein